MDPQGSHDVTLILQSLRQGDEAGLERILPIVYGELQNIARRQMAKEKAGHRTVHRGALGLSNRGGIEPGGAGGIEPGPGGKPNRPRGQPPPAARCSGGPAGTALG
jgi:ECF sigma factor